MGKSRKGEEGGTGETERESKRGEKGEVRQYPSITVPELIPPVDMSSAL